MLLETLDHLAGALRRVRDFLGNYPFVSVLIWTFTVITGTLTGYRLYLDVLDYQIVNQAQIRSIGEKDQKILEYRLSNEKVASQLERANDRLSSVITEKAGIANDLLFERSKLNDAIATARLEGVQQIERERDIASKEIAAVRQQHSDAIELERRLAEKTNKEHRTQLRKQENEIKEMSTAFSSFESRGLWDHGKPSARTLLNAEALPTDLRSQVTKALRSGSMPRDQVGEIMELLALHSEELKRCESFAGDESKIRAEWQAEQGKPITVQSDGITSTTWSSTSRASVGAAAARTLSCKNRAEQLTERIAQALH